MLYLDPPTTSDLVDLAKARSDATVSIYLPTTPVGTETERDRILLKNLSREASERMSEAGIDKRRIAAITEEIGDLLDDSAFWRHQARGLVILATPDNIRTFRVATRLEPGVMVSDRFHLKPLIRSLAYLESAYVLALAEGGVRLVEVPGDLPATTVDVPGMPADASSAGRGTSLVDSTGDRSTGNETKRVQLRHYCRQIDSALRPLLAGSGVPLILATVGQLADVYRSVNTYPHLAGDIIEGNPERTSDADLAASARHILDRLHEDRVRRWHDLYDRRRSQDRATTDLGHAARAATFGAVESALVDMDRLVPGTIDDEGRASITEETGPMDHMVTDEIARRVLLSGGEVLSVRAGDLPDPEQPVSAILRYPI